MDNITLEVKEQEFTNAKQERANGNIPIIYYGKGVQNRSFAVDYQEFRRAFEKGGRSTVYNFQNEKKESVPVLVKDVQYHPVSDEIIHLDVKAVDLNEKVQTSVPLVFVGIAPAVKELGGVLMHNKESVEIECLPNDLVHDIEVDISSLVDFHSSLSVGDIVVPKGIVILDAAEINVATVSAPRSAVEETATPEGAGESAEATEEKSEA